MAYSEFVRPASAAKLLEVSRTTLWRLEQSDPTFPRKIKLSSRCVGYRREALLKWLQEQEAVA